MVNATPALIAGARELGIALSERDANHLIRFLDELRRWNRRYNLTAITAPEEMVVKHLLDSLAVQPYLRGRRIADVGTGAGLPGIPLSVLNPDREFILLDAAVKKTRFITHAAAALELRNITVRHTRVQDYRPDTRFDTVVSRAFASTQEFLDLAGHLCGPGGRILAMKGVYPEAEVAAIEPPWGVEKVQRLDIPGLDAERHLVICCAQK